MGLCRTPSRSTVCALVATLTLSAPMAAFAASPDDPWEPANRSFYFVHNFLDHLFFGAVARGYKAVVPYPVRKGFRNLINNLKEPGIALNDLLQAHPMRAGQTTGRFLVNTTFGLGGLMDLAYDAGLPHHENGFATTAGRWGIPSGPYLFIPFVGPSSVRDLIGQAADTATDPLAWTPIQHGEAIYARGVIDGLDRRAEADDQLKAIDDMSTDPYASLRSLYEQNRAAQIQDAKTGVPGSAEPQFDNLGDPTAMPAHGADPAPPRPAPADPRPGAAIENSIIDAMLARPLMVVRPDMGSRGALAWVASPPLG